MTYTMSSVGEYVLPDFGPDPYFERILNRGQVHCGEEHIKNMFQVVWPIISSYAQTIVGQRDMRSYTALGMFAIGDRNGKRRMPGHVFLLGYPGTGKTLLATTPTEVVGGSAARFQGAADVLPTDYTGNRIIDIDPMTQQKCFKFIPGPGFTVFQILDEFNRLSPKTQGGLLEALGEGTITNFGETRVIPLPPFAIITANPVESEGTYPLSDAFLDRIMFQIVPKDFTADEFAEIIDRTRNSHRRRFTQVCSAERIKEVREFFDDTIWIDSEIKNRMGKFAARTNDLRAAGLLARLHDLVGGNILRKGLSGRGISHWAGAAIALAAFRYRDYVLIDDAKKVLIPFLRHRLIFEPGVLQFLASDVFKTRDIVEARDRLILELIREAW